jgi:cephalosporin hydroxylase
VHPIAIAREAILTHNALQKGGELAAFLALLMDIEPKVVVEIGSDAGGTLWAWQQLGVRVIGVDLPHGHFGSGLRLNDHGCQVVYGDSHDPATRDCLLDALDGDPIDVLFIDGDHTFKGVKQDFDMFAPLVRPGGIVGFHDICDHPTVPQCKVKAFWDSLDGEKEELVTDPAVWGGIGVLRIPALAGAAA